MSNCSFVTLALLAVAGCSTSVEPAYVGDPKKGRAVAQSLCSNCHSIESTGASTNPDAPPLRYILANYAADDLVRDLEHAISINHLRMPTFYFGDRHPADLVAYLQEIQQAPTPPDRN